MQLDFIRQLSIGDPLEMKTAASLETWVSVYQFKRRHISEWSNTPLIQQESNTELCYVSE